MFNVKFVSALSTWAQDFFNTTGFVVGCFFASTTTEFSFMRQKIIAFLFLIFVAPVLAFTGYFLWEYKLKFYATGLARQVHALEQKSSNDGTELDLRSVDAVDWDEVVHHAPYTSLCNYRIEGYERNDSCTTISDDGPEVLLFLKNNRLVGRAYLNTEFQYNGSEYSGRFPKSVAKFLRGNFVYPNSQEKIVYQPTSPADLN
jgi:hypothetical protein